MGKGYIVRRGGGGEQTTKPIFNSVVFAGFTSITVNIENDDNSDSILYYSVVNADPGPDQVDTFEITLDGRTADDATITGLTTNSSYVLYIKAFAVGKFPSDIVTVINQLQTSAPIVATGGTITNYSDAGVDYRVHTFTGNGTFAVTSVPAITGFNELEYLVIAGGGGGAGATRAGAGGAGGYRSSVQGELSGKNSSPETKITLTPGSYGVTVGSGGASGPYSATNGIVSGVQGGNSTVNFPTSIVSIGGGRGGGSDFTTAAYVPTSGGSGGGGWYLQTARYSGTANQGFEGGAAATSPPYGSGGGGAGGKGGDAAQNSFGGPGLSSTIRTGSAEFRAGGGSSSNYQTNSNYPGGIGGGGIGRNALGTTVGIAPSNAAVNTGSGGGASGNGGSGIVIIRYVVGGTV